MANDKSTDQNLEEALTRAQLDKLRLEIADLKHKKSREDRFLQYSPLVTVIVAVAGFLFGIYQFQTQQTKEQQKDRASRETDQIIILQNQIRADVNELLRFTGDQSQPVSRVLFLLEDLNYLLSYSVEIRETSDFVVGKIYYDQKRTITIAL